MKLTIELLNLAYSKSCYSKHEPDLIELNEEDYNEILTNQAMPELSAQSYIIRKRPREPFGVPILVKSNLYERALQVGKFMFRNAIVAPNNLIQQGYIKTFNKNRFETKLYDMIKDREGYINVDAETLF